MDITCHLAGLAAVLNEFIGGRQGGGDGKIRRGYEREEESEGVSEMREGERLVCVRGRERERVGEMGRMS